MHMLSIVSTIILAAACVSLFPLTAWLDRRKKLNEWLDWVIGPEIGREK